MANESRPEPSDRQEPGKRGEKTPPIGDAVDREAEQEKQAPGYGQEGKNPLQDGGPDKDPKPGQEPKKDTGNTQSDQPVDEQEGKKIA